jgi:hypothetical protein
MGLFGEPGVGHRAQWEKCLRIISEEVDRVGNKEIAGAFDEKASTISNALAERDRHYFRGEWLLWLIVNGPTDRVLRFLAACRGRIIADPEPLTDKEENDRRKKAAVKLFGVAGAAMIDDEVYGR